MKTMLTHEALADVEAGHSAPCLSLYQATHRRHPDNQQDPIRFRNLVKELEVIASGPTFAGLVADSFDEIRGSARGSVAILLRMLAAVEAVASLTESADRRQTLQEHLQRIAEAAERTVEAPCDRAQFECRLAHVRAALETAYPSPPEQPMQLSKL